MDNSEKDKIDQYLLGKMDLKERQLFEQRMAEDEAFATEVRLEQKTLNLVDIYFDQQMIAEFDLIHDEVVNKKIVNKEEKTSKFLKPGLILLALTLLSLAFYFLVFQQKETKPAAIYATHYEAYPINFVKRGSSEEANLQEANTFYKNKEYKKALKLLTLVSQNNSDSKILLAAGISALETDKLELALNYFNTIIKNKASLYIGQAYWYAAMTSLKTGDTVSAKNYLQSLIDLNIPFNKEKSKAILDSLN